MSMLEHRGLGCCTHRSKIMSKITIENMLYLGHSCTLSVIFLPNDFDLVSTEGGKVLLFIQLMIQSAEELN